MPTESTNDGAHAEPLAFDPKQALDLFVSMRDRIPAAADAAELLERDLLPRSAAGAPYLVCGIVGPNNAGKSALFNALVGRDLSPSDPTGGATRRLVGAAPSELVDRLEHNPHTSGFHVRDPGTASGVLREALEEPEDPRELILVREDSLPSHLVLIDTPDFDSILAGNRSVSESLLAVADIAVVVVTRHSYRNRAVVEFFREWLRFGRPWLLVYNEAIDEAVARAHAETLIADVGATPLAAYWSPHRLEVQRREVPLAVEPLEIEASGSAAPRLRPCPLRDVLHDAARAHEIKALAFAAALARLRKLATQTRHALLDEDERLGAVGRHGAALAGATGIDIAAQAMPAGPFAEAFRVVLDRRTNVLSRTWRAMVRGVRVGIERLPMLLRARGDDTRGVEAKLDEIERRSLSDAWPGFWETMVRDLGGEARSEARRNSPPAVAVCLDADLGRPTHEVRDAVIERLRSQHTDLGGFQQACEKLIDEAIEARGFDLDIQAAADIATMAPIAFAAAVIFTTTGVGADIAAAGGGAVGTFFFEKYSHVLGSGITKAARKRWSEMRGGEIGTALLEHSLPQTRALLAQRRSGVSGALASLDDLETALP